MPYIQHIKTKNKKSARMTNIYKLNSCVIGSELDLEGSQLKTLQKSLVNTEEMHEGVLF